MLLSLIHILLDGLIEGDPEIMRTENGQVGVAGLLYLIGMAVDQGQVIVVILLAHKTARILAEGTHLVAPGLRICLLYTSRCV